MAKYDNKIIKKFFKLWFKEYEQSCKYSEYSKKAEFSYAIDLPYARLENQAKTAEKKSVELLDQIEKLIIEYNLTDHDQVMLQGAELFPDQCLGYIGDCFHSVLADIDI